MLRVEDVTVHFGGVQALSEVTLEVLPATETGLIGPNGAGKTTLFNVISGLQRTDRGMVLLDGAEITRLSPRRRAHLGVARTFQRLEIFGSMTTRENIQVAAKLHRSWSGKKRNPQTVTDDILGWAETGGGRRPAGFHPADRPVAPGRAGPDAGDRAVGATAR